jgi:hypothetical protein
MRKVQSSKKAIAIACTFALALAAVAISGVPARTQESPVKTQRGVPTPRQEARQEQSLASTKHALSFTNYTASTLVVTSSCSGAFCRSTPSNIYTVTIGCPGPAGTKCTFEVRIAAATAVSSAGENGLYQFLIDGSAPTGGGTDGNGFYAWEVFGAGGEYTSAYSVTSQVRNNVPNEAHFVNVNLACDENMGRSGCTADITFSSLTIRVLKP